MNVLADLFILGLWWWFMPPNKPPETDNGTFIILDSNGNLQNMWDADKPNDSADPNDPNDPDESITSDFEI